MLIYVPLSEKNPKTLPVAKTYYQGGDSVQEEQPCTDSGALGCDPAMWLIGLPAAAFPLLSCTISFPHHIITSAMPAKPAVGL